MSLATNLISFWELEEASGTRNDAVGSNHLADNNTVTQGTGKVGNAAQFTAANSEYLSIASNASLQVGNTDRAMCAWVKAATLPSIANIIAKRSGLGGLEYYLRYISGLFQLEVSADGTTPVTDCNASTFGSPSTATWYFLVVQHDSVAHQLRICVNDGTVDSVSHTGGIFAGTIDFCIGGAPAGGGDYWDGLIDQVGIWGRTLTSGEITALYNGGAGLSYAAMTGGGGGGVTYPQLERGIRGLNRGLAS